MLRGVNTMKRSISFFLKSYIFLSVLFFALNSSPLWAQQCEVYSWPGAITDMEKLNDKIRFEMLTQEMEKFSKSVGHCYARQPVGKGEIAWVNGKRMEKLSEIYAAEDVKKFCAEVKENIIDEKLTNIFGAKSPYKQYANCGEGALVGACLAYHHGFPADDILLCSSVHDHAWALIPEPGKKDSYCLLDRWNSSRCGVKLQGKKQKNSWKGNVSVPGKKLFKFSEATCGTLEQRF